MFVKVTSYDDETLCVVSSADDTYFQHIMPVNRYEDPAFYQMYVTAAGSGYALHYTGPKSDEVTYSSYITGIRRTSGRH